MAKANRRNFISKSAAVVAAGAATGAVASADETPKGKKVWWSNGQKPEKPALFSPAVSYGNLLFLSGIGAHFEGDITAHTKKVLDDIQAKLEACGSSMNKVLKASVFLADLKDYDAMNKVFMGRFGDEPPVRTTVSVAGVPGKSLVEIDVIAYI
ncbi:MAG TPA: RidA family protein [Bryobacteraceae bacterium]|jgi:enamine deaminase RidA (YjgF/YER057c/UK114 family)|nr:RidA family protein [Bryobacteraceae bacterium]